MRHDKFEIGDKVTFIQEDEYTGSGVAEAHRSGHGIGPYTVEDVETVRGAAPHSQWVTINGETYSGYWFVPVRTPAEACA